MLAVKHHSPYEQLLSLPEGLTGEVVAGRLYAHPRPSGFHAAVESNLEIDIGSAYGRGRGGPGGWWIIVEPEVHFVLDAEVTVPDLAGWRKSSLPRIPESHRFCVIPDWLCEITSPSSRSFDREVKLPLYARHGVPYVWLVDPYTKQLEALQLEEGSWKSLGIFHGPDRVSVPPFDAMTLELEDIWP
jgi:Uma2 family endonuclease